MKPLSRTPIPPKALAMGALVAVKTPLTGTNTPLTAVKTLLTATKGVLTATKTPLTATKGTLTATNRAMTGVKGAKAGLSGTWVGALAAMAMLVPSVAFGQIEARLTGYVLASRMTTAHVVSDGGLLAGGISYDFNLPASYGFFWTAGTGIGDIGQHALRPASRVTAASADGTTLVGVCAREVGLAAGFRWSVARGREEIDGPGGGRFIPAAVSADGRVVAGEWNDDVAGPRGAVWTEDGGIVDLGGAAGEILYPTAVSPDGTVVTGWIYASQGTDRVFQWTRATGPVVLGTPSLPGAELMLRDVSLSGVAVGIARLAEDPGVNHAFRWSSEHGLALIEVAGATHAGANAVSADGSTVVGTFLRAADGRWACFRWTPAGVIDLSALIDARAPLADGWRMGEMAGISDDGRSFAGEAIKPLVGIQGLIVTLSCAADFNADGMVDLFDYTAFAEAFERGSPSGADFNHDGFVDFFDYDAFVAAFEAGC